jgi:dihydroflavonol-4-reductase
MTTLVTGATGLVGSAVARRLVAAGHRVRVLTRRNSDLRNLAGLDVQTVVGDLAEPRTLDAAVAGCENLFHVAADYRLWVPDPVALYRVNVEGTREIIRRAMQAGVRRIVYTSSVAALGLLPDGEPADETTPADIDSMIGHYKRSKYLAEHAVLELIGGENAPVVIVNPSAPVGPRDIRPTPTGRIVIDVMRRRMPAYVDTGLNVVHVDDVAEGHLLAFERGRIGECYILGGENLTLKQILDRVAHFAGVPAPKLKIPHAVVLPIAWGAELAATLFGFEPFATVDGVRMARKKMFFRHDKAARELGYAPRPADEAFRDAVQWFRDSGYAG